MGEPLTATQLRKDIYRILDELIETGETREIVRGDARVLLVPTHGRRVRLAALERRSAMVCSFDELVETRWDYGDGDDAD